MDFLRYFGSARSYCALLADEDHDVREPAEYYVSCCLTVDTIYHHFVDCVLYYNNQETGILFHYLKSASILMDIWKYKFL